MILVKLRLVNTCKFLYRDKIAGFGLFEVCIAVFCFLVAAIPIAGIFSFNIENSRIIHSKALTFTAANELINQIQLLNVDQLSLGTFDLGTGEGQFPKNSNNNESVIFFSELPASFFRKLTIEKVTGNFFKVTASIKTPDQPRADIEISRVFGNSRKGNRGGK
ncbi:MAG: hypothetical protein HQM08_14465 [Candidatus Riflebacteria bacterium]|nr:hypothetical protein [Candidatus Riflebacteria bacterium]